ncbi:SDR family oxidoreductase [Adhaeribacter sp. BT258]|uniref:SDR family oxidoreductase n=2 Tax=Adhaeribacter terrigena TaxID=2793070 RepID=A0ABS1C327_9BACT|nr:SDR family oxidoreductase [Adhaeribacter terrigena]MBK0403809.1 SDR family oxidoreductase [Adhaeribacter terrigena]
MNLKGKLIIITGVSKGIGLATAQALLEAGAVVAGWGRSKPKLDHLDFHFFPTDVQDQYSVEDAFTQTTQQLGADIFGLINNAGLGITGKFEELSVEDWRTMFRTNVDGIFYCTRLVLPEMKRLESGHIINISSIAGTTGIEEMSGYCATKHAVRGISASLYKEVRNFGIKVTCIYPGSVQTNFFDNIGSVTANENMMQPEDIASTILHALQSSPNYHHVDIEVRPLMPKGKQKR